MKGPSVEGTSRSVLFLKKDGSIDELTDCDNLYAHDTHISHRHMEIEPITGARLHRKFCTMRISSEGVDGRDLQALRDLPLTLHVMLAGLLEKVEKEGRWPRMLALGLITLTPKGEGMRPLEMRPLSVLSLIYRAWGGLRMPRVAREVDPQRGTGISQEEGLDGRGGSHTTSRGKSQKRGRTHCRDGERLSQVL